MLLASNEKTLLTAGSFSDWMDSPQFRCNGSSICRRHDVDPQLFLAQLLMNLPSARMNDLTNWLPDQWKQPSGRKDG